MTSPKSHSLADAAAAYDAAAELKASTSAALTEALVAARGAGASWSELAETSGLSLEMIRWRVDTAVGRVSEPRPELEGHVGQAEAARILGVSQAWLGVLSRQDKIPFSMAGKFRRYDKEVLSDIVSKRGK